MKKILSIIVGLCLLFSAVVSFGQTTYYQTIKFRSDTAASWTQNNPVLMQGEPAFEWDSGRMKVGDGLTHWTALAYQPPPSAYPPIYWGQITGSVPNQVDLYNNYLSTYVPMNNPTFTGKLTTQPSSTYSAGISIPQGTAPTTPSNGDVWTTANGLYVQINGVTMGPFAIGQPVSNPGWFKNLVIKTPASTQVTVTADGVGLLNPSNNAATTILGVAVTITITNAGPNGLDTGTLSASSWYSVWVIYNPITTTIAGLISINTGSPSLPTGYTYMARLGWVRTSASSTLVPTNQYGRRVQYANGGSGLPMMASGAAGNLTTPTWVAVATGAFVPPTAFQIIVLPYEVYGWGVAVAPNSSYGGIMSATNPPFAVIADPSANYITAAGTPIEMTLESSNIYWANGGATSYLYVSGWEDNI
jgi:hypothetical protein